MKKVFLIILLFSIVFFQIIAEKLPIQESTIGDSTFFLKVSMEFLDTFEKNNYSLWQVSEILPFALLNIIFVFAGFGLEPAFLQSGMILLNLFFLLISVYSFFRIMDMLQLNKNLECLAFVILFFNYFFLKEIWYNPFNNELAVLATGLVQVNLFLRNKRDVLLLVSFVGMFVSPFLPLIGLLFLVFPYDYHDVKISEKPISGISKVLILAFVLLLFVLGLISGRLEQSWTHWMGFVMSVLAFASLLYWTAKISPIEWHVARGFVKKGISSKQIMILISGLAVVYTLLFLLSGAKKTFGILQFYQDELVSAFQFPFDFLISHTLYFGLLIPFSLIFLRKLIQESLFMGLGFTLILTIFLFIAIHPTSGHLVAFVPALFLGLMKVLRRYRLKGKDLVKVSLLNLSLSMFWMDFNNQMLKGAMEKRVSVDFLLRRNWTGISNPQDYLVMILVFFAILSLLFMLELGKRRYVRRIGH